MVKTSSLFLGFSLVMIGDLYVLRIAEAQYQLQIEGPVKGNLASSSPGLVILTLGVILVGLVSFPKSKIELEQSPAKTDVALTPNIEVRPPKSQTPGEPGLSPAKSKPPSSDIEEFTSLSFASGSVVLSDGELKKVDVICRYLQTHRGNSITVEAFGDPGNSAELNLGLSDRRASYIKDLLSQRCSSGPKVKFISYGKERPDTGSGQAIVRLDK